MTVLQTEPPLLDEVSGLMDVRPDLLENPYPIYHRMRSEAPVLLHGAVAAVTRYDDVDAVLRDTAHYSNHKSFGSRVDAVARNLDEEHRATLQYELNFFDLFMPQLDPPDHTRVRGLAHKAFTPRRIADMRGQIKAIVNELLDRAESKKAVNLMDDLCYKLPVSVIGSMLGAAPEDIDAIRRWSITESEFSLKIENVDEIHASRQEFRAYIRTLIRTHRQTRHTDLLAALLEAEEEGDRLSAEELEAMFVILLFSGHETTTSLIGNAIRALLIHPEQLSLLVTDRSLISSAVEETLRWDSSTQMIHRVARDPTVIRDVVVPAGYTVRLFLGAANRDPEHFDQPDLFDVKREDLRHLAFGIGPHYCLGQALARLETHITLEVLVERYPDMQLAGEPRYRPNMQLRGPEYLPVRLK